MEANRLRLRSPRISQEVRFSYIGMLSALIMKSPRLRHLKRDGKLQVIRLDDSNALDLNSMFCQEKFYWLHGSTDLPNPSK